MLVHKRLRHVQQARAPVHKVVYCVIHARMITSLILCFAILSIVSAQSPYYGCAFGVASNWTLVDRGRSHHLEVYFQPMPNMDDFQANIDVRSTDGSSLNVAVTTQLSAITSLFQGQGNTGVRQLDADGGFTYCNFLNQSQFQTLPEGTYVKTLKNLLANSQYVYFWGQVYSDNADGIHDIHRITLGGYGDGGLVVEDNSGNYVGVFAYFNDQSVC